MKKYFISSDIHSFFDEWMEALKEKDFDINNSEHIIMVLGDLFDRGDKTNEIIDFILSLPKERTILIRGNHEDLFMEYVYSGYPEPRDFHNKTNKTMKHIFGFENGITIKDFNENKVSMVFDRLINYYETDKYIFVHAFIPVKEEDDILSFDESWRDATGKAWYKARWKNPFEMNLAGFNETGKTIVFGHWGNYLYRKRNPFDSYTFGHSIYYGNNFIGLDTTTCLSNKVNVLVLEEKDM